MCTVRKAGHGVWIPAPTGELRRNRMQNGHQASCDVMVVKRESLLSCVICRAPTLINCD